jgi:uncharacterized protein (TIGR02996 family)
MQYEQGFLRAIADAPKDNGLRLIYADWLEERRDPRGELIRVCQAMRAVPVWSDHYWELKARRNELWVRCPLKWLEATGYDGSYYDPVFRDGVPDGWRQRWRLIREFTERWHGIDVPDVGGRAAEVRQAEERLGLALPPSLQEYVAFIHDLADSSPPHDPRRYNTLFHSACSVIHHLRCDPAVSLIHFTLDSRVLGIARADLTTADPRTYCFDEVVDENGVSFPPPSSRSPRPPTLFAPSLSLSIFQCLFIELPTAGTIEAYGASPDDWLPRLAADFPVHARFDDAHVFETDELLVLVRSPGGSSPEHLVEGILRRPVPFESIPPYLFGGTGRNVGSSGMLGPESFRRQLEADARQPGARPFLPWWDGVRNLAHFGIWTYAQWLQHAGRYPLWLSILRRSELERLQERQGGSSSASPPLPPDMAPVDGGEDIPF